ncbi:hypothetical protein [Arthrobacter sp. MDT1-65]
MDELNRLGWVESIGVRTPGLGSVNVPVWKGEDMVAAVCLAMPLARVNESPGKDHGDLVILSAQRITEVMNSG